MDNTHLFFIKKKWFYHPYKIFPIKKKNLVTGWKKHLFFGPYRAGWKTRLFFSTYRGGWKNTLSGWKKHYPITK